MTAATLYLPDTPRTKLRTRLCTYRTRQYQIRTCPVENQDATLRTASISCTYRTRPVHNQDEEDAPGTKPGRGKSHLGSTSRPRHCTYRGTSLIRNSPRLGPYSRTIPRVVRWSWGGGCFLCARYPCIGRAPLYLPDTPRTKLRT